ncbi:MAG: prepilin peptidase, partial [Gammaproteobacteria bacterium]|nr:prepilin peptidase [Gammaproteobacteria bacterium]
TLIRAWQNIPVVSFLLLRGRCASCQTKISWRYPLVELFTGILTVAVAFHFGWGWPVLAAFILTWTLIAASGIDYDHQLLPDHLTLPLMWLGLLLSLFHQHFDATPLFPTPTDAILGAALGYAILRGIYQLFKWVTGKEGMGFGDFKLLAALGAWFGWQYLLLIIMLSAGVGAIIGLALIWFTKHGREKPIPFGPFLAAAGWLALLWGPEVVAYYAHHVFSY